jgi:mRNA-degrading endonuclease YafQ of YafQ-DinJ toxin-antitoxin module
MQGVEDIWEASVTLSYRITYEVRAETVVLRRIGAHDILRKEKR